MQGSYFTTCIQAKQQIVKICVLYLVLLFPILVAAQANVTMIEDFENPNWSNNWFASAGVWEVGTPTSGPNCAFNSSNCAATILAGDYPDNVDSQFIRHVWFAVPSAESHPRLRFWHWFNFSGDDWGEVQIKTPQTDWTTISLSYYGHLVDSWSKPMIDLTAYAGSTIQIALLLHTHVSGGWGDWTVAPGWYIDDITLETGDMPFDGVDTFDADVAEWYTDYPTWEIGIPTSGPGNAHSGTSCAATILNGNYADNYDTRLISPKFVVSGMQPQLCFWHWYNFSSDDWGEVQIKTENTDWQPISRTYYGHFQDNWTYPRIDITAYVDSTVQISFYLHTHVSGGWGDWTVTSGWYVDDISIEEKTYAFNPFENFDGQVGTWEDPLFVWEVGAPTSGPNSAYSQPNCLATVLAGDYWDYNTDAWCVSPKFVMGHNSPQLTFWHWFNFNSDDYGQVMIKNENQDWQEIGNSFWGNGGNAWTNYYIPLEAYADSTVQIAFKFYAHVSGGWGDWTTGPGWYIDNINVTGSAITDNEDFNQPPEIVKLSNYPNPFNTETKLIFNLPKRGRTQLSIYNIKGQLVTTILDGNLDKGSHNLKWNGKDASGNRVSSGIYFARLTTNRTSKTQRMILLK